jgi:3-hydroxyacyl-CoA dehydrogenase
MRRIKKIAVLGSGIMGSRIACHLANVGLEVLLLDLPAKESSAGSPARNSMVEHYLQVAIKDKPSPLYLDEYAQRISLGNYEDDFEKIKHCDWILEAIVENLEIKIQVFEKVEKYRTPGTLVSSNTSGIPIHKMLAHRSEDFCKHFFGTHFFNPPRYLELLEIIPTDHVSEEVIDFMMEFGRKVLGKNTVKAKDTPAFIANRVGVYAMAKIFELTAALDLDIEIADKLTGEALGRPNTGTFRLADLVGLDTAIKVIRGIRDHCPEDAMAQSLQEPDFLSYLVDNSFFGNKSGQGFYKKTQEKDERGKNIILGLDLKTKQYRKKTSSALPSLSLAKQIEHAPKRIRALFDAKDKGGELIRESMLALFSYASLRVPEIADSFYSIDVALRSGFAWDYGPFEYWDIIGLDKGIEAAEQSGYALAPWVLEMKAAGITSFYRSQAGKKVYYNVQTRSYVPIPGQEKTIHLEDFRENSPVYKNSEMILHDIGDGVLNLEFVSKMNAIGEGILRGINESIGIAEQGNWRGLVIGNQAKNFTVGANLMMIAMLAYEQEFEQLNGAVKLFQDTSMRIRYSKIPVVIATQGYVFGGGCEFLMHANASVCSAESYIGLVEVGVGLLPGGGGTKEFALRASDAFHKEGDVEMPTLIEKFKTIAMAEVATSAPMAYEKGYLNAKDTLVINKSLAIATAKRKVIELSENYIAPTPRKDVRVLGRQGLSTLLIAANELKLAKYASEHDIKIAQKIASVLCGGDLSYPQQVTEQYLLDLEREAFLSLCGEPKTLQRIQHMLEKGKPLRN